ncbi:MAG: 3-hydroxyacyl-CoA dehydrogenase, partial [Pseudomonas sp.]|nr:3-hydroxyacyl-CoA dehydrogenase [Pseudomonas sp.]
ARGRARLVALVETPGQVVEDQLAPGIRQCHAVLQGVGTPGDIDLAMRAGVNYPRGPLAWADDLGVGFTLDVLDNLQRSYGEERYRPSLLLRRTHAEGGRLHG